MDSCDKCHGPLGDSKYRRPDPPETLRFGPQVMSLRLNLDGEAELDVQPPLCKPCWCEESPLCN